MGIEVYQRGETVPIWTEVKDSDGVLTDPSEGVTLVYLTDPEDTKQVEDVAMTKDAVGKYVYYYASVSGDEAGWWRYQTKSQDGAGDSARYVISEGGFELK